MRYSTILGMLGAASKKSKYRIIFVGLEFAYLSYHVIKRQREKRKGITQKDETSA